MDENPVQKEYLKRLGHISAFYMRLVISVGIAIAIAIFISAMLNVLAGLVLAFSSAFIYLCFSTSEYSKRLGIRYANERGVIRIVSARAVYGDTLFIPSKVIFADVTEIEDGAFNSEKNTQLKKIYLPATLKSVGNNLFGEYCSPETIYFEGTEEQWSEISGTSELGSVCVEFEITMPSLPKKEKGKSKNEANIDEQNAEDEK